MRLRRSPWTGRPTTTTGSTPCSAQGLDVARLAVLAQGPAGEPAAPRGRIDGHGRRHPRAGRMGPEGGSRPRDRLPPQPRLAPGLHRRSRGGRPGRDARRDEADGGRSQEDQPASTGRAGHRPFGAGGRGGDALGIRRQRRARIPAATASGTRSSAGARMRSRTSRSCLPTPESSTR